MDIKYFIKRNENNLLPNPLMKYDTGIIMSHSPTIITPL